jgi:hypothetical protein
VIDFAAVYPKLGDYPQRRWNKSIDSAVYMSENMRIATSSTTSSARRVQMTAWIYDRTHWIVDKEHPSKTVVRVAAIVLSLLPFVMAAVILT